MNRTIPLIATFAVLVSVLSGCGGYNIAPVNAYTPTYDEYTVELGNKKVDVLFVVDTSGSMSTEQATLARSIPDFISHFTSADRFVDYHIGVLTTDTVMNPDVMVQVFKADGVTPVKVPMTNTNLEVPLPQFGIFEGPGSLFVRNVRFDGTQIINTSDPVAVAPMPKYLSLSMGTSAVQERFGRDAMPGIDNTGFEAPFLSLTQFLQPDKLAGWNAGFLRSDSLFSVIVVSDEDESMTACNSESIDPYLRSQACLDREQSFLTNPQISGTTKERLDRARQAYMSTVPEAKALRLEEFRTIFKRQRGKRLSLLSLDTVVAKQAKYPNGDNCAGGSNFGATIQEVSREFNRGTNKDSKIHNLCVTNFATSISAIGETLATAVEDEFELEEDRIDPKSVAVEVNGQLLKSSSFTYDIEKNTVKINDFEVDVNIASGKLTVRIYYDKWIDLVDN